MELPAHEKKFEKKGNFIRKNLTKRGLQRQAGEYCFQAAVNKDLSFAVGEEVTLGFREEHVAFGVNENANNISAVLAEKTFMGDHTEYLFYAGDMKIGVRASEKSDCTTGETLLLNIDKNHTMVLKKK